MTQNDRAGESGYARLAAINPVPPSERDNLVARLSEIKPQLPRLNLSATRRRWKPTVVALAVVILLAVGGVAVAASWSPLSGIGAADRPVEPTDTLSAAVKEQIREHAMPGGVIGARLVDEARLLGELPDGHKVYAVPTSNGKLCILVAESGEACFDPLTHAEPITFESAKRGPAAPLVIWGATADDVVSISFEAGGNQ